MLWETTSDFFVQKHISIISSDSNIPRGDKTQNFHSSRLPFSAYASASIKLQPKRRKSIYIRHGNWLSNLKKIDNLVDNYKCLKLKPLKYGIGSLNMLIVKATSINPFQISFMVKDNVI